MRSKDRGNHGAAVGGRGRSRSIHRGRARRCLPRNIGIAAGVATGMTTLGIVGAGHIGSTVARLAVDAGVDVVLANSRGPETLADLVADLGPRARAATSAEAARDTDLVVLT